MKNKKIIIIFSILLILIIIGGYFAIRFAKMNKNKDDEEYVPQEEISEEQLRKTIVTLYFVSKETNELVPEARLIDIKEIINDASDKLVNLLIEGPKNEKCKNVFPQDTKLLKTYMEGDTIYLDLSKELLNYDKSDEKNKENLINSIVNTLTELTEINGVKILIDGEQNNEFNELYTAKK